MTDTMDGGGNVKSAENLTIPTDTEASVRAALDRVLASATFAQVERLRRFLEFITVETLAGRGSQLKEYLVGTEVFSKATTFDPRNDPIVRVQAGRLRAKLAAYYAEEGKEDALRIELPKGSYVPIFHGHKKELAHRQSVGLPASENSIAVVPFADHSPAGDQGHLCHGIGEEILGSLIRIESLRVVLWTNAIQREAGMAGILEAAEGLGVGTIITGSVRKMANRVRVAVHLIDASRSQYVWTHTFERDAEDAFAVQDEVAQVLAEALQGQLANLRSGPTARSTGNLAAYNHYLKGRYHCNQRSEKALRQAVECFEHALAEDPRYALAHSGVADASALLVNYGYASPLDAWPKAVLAANTGVLIDPKAAETHASLAHVRATHAWDFAGAETEFRTAISLNPRYAAAHHWFGIAGLAPTARLEEAIEEVETALAIDPTSPIFSRDLAILYYFKRDLDTALDQAIQTIEQDPYFGGAYWMLGLIHEQRRSHSQALECLEKAAQLTPDNPRVLSATGRVLALSGSGAAARTTLAAIDELARTRYVSALDPALVLFALGEKGEAFERLSQTLPHPSFGLMHLRVDPRFDGLREDPRLGGSMARLMTS